MTKKYQAARGDRQYRGDGVVKLHKIDYASVKASKKSLQMVDLIEEYVANDDGHDGAPLCTELHGGEICRKVEGHE